MVGSWGWGVPGHFGHVVEGMGGHAGWWAWDRAVAALGTIAATARAIVARAALMSHQHA
jgi:hypothetical protein